MRLRIFSGKTVSEAMERVRRELGDDAIIVNVDQEARGRPARITAAIESAATPDDSIARLAARPEAPAPRAKPVPLDLLLRYHGLPSPVAGRIAASAAAHADVETVEALSLALDQHLKFRPLSFAAGSRIMLVGQPGHGKTLGCARLVAQAGLDGMAVRVLTLDSVAAGALAQLEAFCAPFEAQLFAVEDSGALPGLLAAPFGGLTVIDTAGVNPYALADIELLAHAVQRAEAEPVWVLGAGCDAMEAAELAEVFASLGVRRMIASRLDASRRLGAVLTAAMRSGLALSAFGASPYLGDSFLAADSALLADMLLTKPDPAHLARLTERSAA